MEQSTLSSKRWPGLGLAASTAVIGFFIGAWLGSVAASPGDGLAGGAHVLSGGLGGAALVVLAAMLFVRRTTRGAVVKALWIAGPLALLLLTWFIVRAAGQIADQGDEWREEQERLRRMKPSATPSLFHYASWTGDQPGTPTRTTVPAPGLLSTTSSAPIPFARSGIVRMP
ncbi:MAG: hypothetical protein IPM68_19290 [Flavobacteriales bacterium]|nr:hypothetical protein [Flavobacteriales bacterium]